MATDQLISQLAAATPERPVRLGRYDVTGLIGEGGMGTVYDAIDLEHGTRVALKTLASMNAANLLRFKNEFRSVADLSHPNLVSLYELSYHNDLWFFTMDHIDGVDFVEWLRGVPVITPDSAPDTVVESPHAARKAGAANVAGDKQTGATVALPPSLARVRAALAQLIAGVHALHEAGYVHLDIKPSNVIVDAAGTVFVLDFGLIRRVDEPRSSQTSDADSISISGTPMWMAPEQFTDAAITTASDWYAVGLMLYWSLTGVPAFAPVETASEAAAARRGTEPTPPLERLADVPLDLSELTVALLRANPELRPTSRTLLELTAGKETLATKQQAAFVGRHNELRVLRDAFERVRAGGAQVVHLVGASGLGKTALLRRFLHEVRADGDVLTLNSRCYERETMPYKAFDGLLDQLATKLTTLPVPDLPKWIAELVHVFPVLETVPGVATQLQAQTPQTVPAVERRRRAVVALCELLQTLATAQPVVLQIDDLQWADADSILLLIRLITAPTFTKMMLVMSFRPGEANASTVVAPYLHVVATMKRPLVVELGPLSSVDTETLAKQQLEALDVTTSGMATAIAHESAGVPFFVEELAHFVAQHKDHNHDAAVATGVSLDEVLAQRVKSLPEQQRALVEVLSVANSPIPLHVAFEEAGMASGALRSLWALRGRHLIRTTGASADDHVELHHDRMRESVLNYLPASRVQDIHIGLARAFADEGVAQASDAWVFDSVRHFNAVHPRLTGSERKRVAHLNLVAGLKARQAVAFPLAFDCFHAGAALLDSEAWNDDYDLALALHAGAAETAYLSAAWDVLDHYIDVVKTNGRSVFDQLVGWEVQIDACIGRKDYANAVAVAIEALRLLDTDLPANPSESEVGAAVQQAMASLASVGADGLMQLPMADDPKVVAAMRIQSRISSAAYFAAPLLFPVIACRLVVTSVERGLSSVTAYALSVYGIVLNTLGMHDDAQTWGEVALQLLERFKDPTIEARTRHVIHNLVCLWTVPLSTAVPKLREAVDIGRATGDVEYAAYAAHGYVHNAMYAGMPLAPLYTEAIELGDFMRSHEEVNALHVHEPFEQILRCYLGMSDNPATLDGNGYSEEAALAAASDTGSSAGVAAINTVMGMARYMFGAPTDAHTCFEIVRPMLAAMPSVWHLPMFHQFAALSIYALPETQRQAHDEDAEANLAALRHLAKFGPENFAHRVALLEAERARCRGDIDTALRSFDQAITLASAGGWINDVALAHELAARCAQGSVAEAHASAARNAYKQWGAIAKLSDE